MNGWLSTLLIFLPLGGALVCLVLPRQATGPFALLVSLVEVGFWVDALARFDFSRGLQFEQQASWFSDLNVSYHVGMFGFSLWLVGLTAVAMTAAIAYAFVVGRERPRAFFALMLVLTGALVGVFTAQDLLLFYVMFEAMLIPLYVLVGVWGGAGRLGATFKFVAYTMAGSLLMLVSIDLGRQSLATFLITEGGSRSS
jgi:NADH-quinone oxidoreductase subunit M